MAARPMLKGIMVHRGEGQVVLWPRALRRMYLQDHDGSLAVLLGLLAEARPRDELQAGLSAQGFDVSEEQLSAVLATLDEMGVLIDADGDETLDEATRERHQSNLRYYDLFASLEHTSAAMHAAAQQSRVLLLGAGGIGSGILQSLVGLGVGQVTVVDQDQVETKNLARQFVYGLAEVGRPKVYAAQDWAKAYSSGTSIIPVHARVTDVATVLELGADADIVVCAIDSPEDIRLIVNEACFALGIPFVAGGLNYSTLSYWSVEPGRSPCWQCLALHRTAEAAVLPEVLRQEAYLAPASVNRATGPMAQLMCGLMAMEVMRYLTRSDPPVAAATYQVIEVADGLATSSSAWQRHPDCPMCRAVR
ncbi:ThiF family adenylyltransferase [Hamadaea sp. NPDC050747]|uniref:HesA/MoeB/ThiF family protein n=1 Tax=Hamadaea sp. NPDC050747 TaxID=3155789 RepID=UPI0033C427BF